MSNADLLQRRTNAVPRGIVTATPVFADRAENAEIWDIEGRRYVDFAGGIAVLGVGHRHPKVLRAVRAQLDRFSHTSFQVMAYDVYVELAERLNAIAPLDGPAQTILFTTGAEATENAAKIARAATGRQGIITFTGAFHGRTALASAMTGKVAPYKRQFGSSLPDVFHAPFPNEARGIGLEESLRAIDFIFQADVHPESVAAIVLEPVQGEGGFNPAPPAFLRALRALCDKHGILLVADEVQTGFARTGRMFGIEHSGIAPDLICIAKSLAGGFPLSGVIGRREIMDKVEPGGLGGTYGGSPIACAAALAVLDIIEEEQLVARAATLGDRLRSRIEGWRQRNGLVPISAPRGLGAMIAFDIMDRNDSGQIAPGGARPICERALERGLILLSCGPSAETVRLLMPLTATDEIVDEGLDYLEAALSVVDEA